MPSSFPTSLDNFTTSHAVGAPHTNTHQNNTNDAINKVQARVIKEAPLNLTWPEYGMAAANTGAQNDTAVAAGKSALGANGGEMLIPTGSYDFTGLNFDDTRNVVLKGQGGVSAGAATATQLVCTSGAGVTAVSAKSSFGFRLADIQLVYENAAFNGKLIDLSWSGAATDASFASVDRCYLGGLGVSGAAALAHLRKTISSAFRDCVFGSAAYGVRGLDGGTDYSNVITFDNCTFVGQTSAAAAAAGDTWLFNGCTFQQLASGAAGAFIQDQGGHRGLTFIGCGFYDANSSGNWIHTSGHAVVIKGCIFGAGSIGVVLASSTDGHVIQGNDFEFPDTGIYIPANCSGVFMPNRFVGCTTPINDLGNIQTANYNLAFYDAERTVEINSATAKTVTIDPAATTNFPMGTKIRVDRMGAGTVTFVAGAGVTIRSRGSLLAINGQYGSATVRKRGTNEWVLEGDLV